ncbi:MAG TPA: DUF4476 domain-containing protein [Ignavibacteriaceae bacterium]|nr:DUF4476 domain-containing protein [Ignavibacteriaceae bacterium]
MHKFILLFLIPVLLPAQEKTFNKRIEPVKNPIETIDLISLKLMTLEQEYLIKLNHKDYIRARRLISEVEDLIKTLPIVEEIVPGVTPINEHDFKILFDEIKAETFESDQLLVIRSAGLYNFFTVLQIAELLELFSFPSGKIEAIKTIYPNVIDKQNSHLLLGKFEHSSDKEKVRKLLSAF